MQNMATASADFEASRPTQLWSLVRRAKVPPAQRRRPLAALRDIDGAIPLDSGAVGMVWLRKFRREFGLRGPVLPSAEYAAHVAPHRVSRDAAWAVRIASLAPRAPPVVPPLSSLTVDEWADAVRMLWQKASRGRQVGEDLIPVSYKHLTLPTKA